MVVDLATLVNSAASQIPTDRSRKVEGPTIPERFHDTWLRADMPILLDGTFAMAPRSKSGNR